MIPLLLLLTMMMMMMMMMMMSIINWPGWRPGEMRRESRGWLQKNLRIHASCVMSGRFEFQKRVSAWIALDGFQPINSWSGQRSIGNERGEWVWVVSNPHSNSLSPLLPLLPLLLCLSIMKKEKERKQNKKTKRQKNVQKLTP
jgi:preprotein translocase subunit YajC